MHRLVTLAGVTALTILANPGWAATYVPGQVRDGVYVRPHFVAVSEHLTPQLGDASSHGLPEDVAPGPAGLDRPALGGEAIESES